MKIRNISENQKALFDEREIQIRFSEVDSMSIVWHGSYVKYFEDGRESFGAKYGLGYMDVYAKGFMIPIVKLDINYKKSLFYGDTAIVKTTFVESPASKIIFNYEIHRKSDNQAIATGQSVQVFMNTKRELELLPPLFFIDWKNKYLKSDSKNF
jgi:acyl-CoA thioester hydrolase